MNRQSNEINNLKEQNKILLEEIKNIKQQCQLKETKFGNNICIKSAIMKENEFDYIKDAIEFRLNKKIKEIIKLYQASIDGGEVSAFHSKCDNIPNTLTIIKSEGNKRFGGFTSLTWESSYSNKWKDDKNAFLFSLDKKQIYPYKNSDKRAICCNRYQGPCFGNGHDIGIIGNIIKETKLYTYEWYQNDCSFDYKGDSKALSEDGTGKRFMALEYEVFNIIFN